ncbi:glycine reductase [Treponema vincentii]|uniref:glycine/sarcosine/betaine reductase complex component C subunit alpha n=1 Tax=Treponema vincentii TaxID=69710 RepID=UPI0020A573A5|nr:glycine/sarcosine/betaine reductase complex component C subunit alpha [Treponema vincentii]UTC59654.1 glycine reductase [Treponema vincentii]
MSSTKQQLADAFSLMAKGLETGAFAEAFPVGLTVPGSEHGEAELIRAAKLAAKANPGLDIVLIGGPKTEGFRWYEAPTLEDAHHKMEELFKTGEIKAAVTMHYTFPLGVTTIGKVVTPGFGKEMFIASTTGASDADRYKAMLLNTFAGIAVAKANGVENPTVGLLNIDGVATIEKALLKLQKAGYPIRFTESHRADGGVRMRGNDLLQGTPDVMVCDTLTGNVLMKLFSSFLTGGSYEASGSGYGPCAGKDMTDVVAIVSRASGAPVIAAALAYSARSAQANLQALCRAEVQAAEKAGLQAILDSLGAAKEASAETVAVPPKKTVTEEIHGIDVIDIENACKTLWKENIYAEAGMGCTGPVILLAGEDAEKARKILTAANYI